MHIERIRLSHYRNLVPAELSFSPSVNIFVGENGQGKTNLLEAIHWTTQGCPFRPGKASDFIDKRDSQDFARIETTIQHGNLRSSIEVLIQPSRKKIELNHKRATSAQLSRLFPTVLFSPDCLAAIKSGPEERRALVDDLLTLLHPQHRALLLTYRRALKSRNQLLKMLKDGNVAASHGDRLLDSLNQGFFDLATELTQARIQALNEIQPVFRSAVQSISDEPNVDISVDYLISDQSAADWDRSQIHNAMQERAKNLRAAEIAMGKSLVGPNKHDIKLLFAGNDSRFYCSQGQQRALILAFKMAQIIHYQRRHGVYPLLLLDDVLSELDVGKRFCLIQFLRDIDSQIMMTTTDLDQLESFNRPLGTVYQVSNGQIYQSEVVQGRNERV